MKKYLDAKLFATNISTVRGVHSAHIEYAIRGTDSKNEFITTDFTDF